MGGPANIGPVQSSPVNIGFFSRLGKVVVQKKFFKKKNFFFFLTTTSGSPLGFPILKIFC